MRLSKLTHVMAANREAGIATLAVGRPGVGKTAIVQQYVAMLAETVGEPVGFLVAHLSTMESPDVRGMAVPVTTETGEVEMRWSRSPLLPAGTNYWIADDDGLRLAQADDPVPEVGVLFLDELFQAQKETLFPTARLIHERRIGDYSLPEGWQVVAATNRAVDKSTATREMPFLTNRVMRIEVTPHIEDAASYWSATGMNPFAIMFARRFPDVILEDTPVSDGKAFCTPRSFEAAIRFMQVRAEHTQGDDDEDLSEYKLKYAEYAKRTGLALDQTTREAVAGLIGESAAFKLIGFTKLADELPDWNEIVRDPKQAKVPEDHAIDATYAAQGIVLANVDKKTAKQGLIYMTRLRREFALAGMTELLKRKEILPVIGSTKEFGEFAMANPDLVAQVGANRAG